MYINKTPLTVLTTLLNFCTITQIRKNLSGLFNLFHANSVDLPNYVNACCIIASNRQDVQ